MKRNGKRILSALIVLAAAAAGWFILGRQQAAQRVYTKNIFAMDTIFTLKVYGPKGEKALSEAEKRVRELEALFSVTAEGSDIWRVNREQGDGSGAVEGAVSHRKEVKVSPDTFSVIEAGLQLGDETGGALDITIYPVLREWGFTTGEYGIPGRERVRELLQTVDYRRVAVDREDLTVIIPKGMELDLGALAKGYTGDSLVQILREMGVESAILDLGGNVQTLGRKPDGSPWQVAVKNPFDPGEELGVLKVADKAVVTSGSYERYFAGEDDRKYWHILDPASGYPADNGLVSVTVVGESGIRCDGLSTALFVMGQEKAVDFWREKRNFEMILVTEDGELFLTEGLADCFQTGEGWHREIIGAE